MYPSIARTAQSEPYWAGRTRLHGVTPATDVVSAVSTRGWVRFMLTTEAGLPPEFLTRLVPPSGRTVHVVVDASWATVDWPRRVPDGVVLHPLPSCERGR
ncbi:hypothetical protein [Phytohabitans rumicis]|uniref:Uncharacterized protein n=1 Tax=Phytohabitans rumicis TaxID=1076125 RepID=A0A6V8KWD4_9ACTN|nr:hypothetical protein [Phytohabitans rumicis]GFJ89393.1 hypothetical protein Prum_030350 [Phytohabitans rumicis]